MAIWWRPEQLDEFKKNVPKGRPVHLLNLLKFKPRAEYADGRECTLTGFQAYDLYGRGVAKLIEALGGRRTFAGLAGVQLIGEGQLAWDAVAIVEYPSPESFLGMVSSPEYQELHVHREAGLEHQLLIQCDGRS